MFGESGLAGYEFWEYDTRLGRWWGVDRNAAKYPSLSPYQFCAGNPIWMKDVDGSDFVVVIDNSGDNKTITVQMMMWNIHYALPSTPSCRILIITMITIIICLKKR